MNTRKPTLHVSPMAPSDSWVYQNTVFEDCAPDADPDGPYGGWASATLNRSSVDFETNGVSTSSWIVAGIRLHLHLMKLNGIIARLNPTGGTKRWMDLTADR